jgi:hypothetical protein
LIGTRQDHPPLSLCVINSSRRISAC